MAARIGITLAMTDATGYDRVADTYRAFVGESCLHRVAIPALLDVCGTGRDVVDLACGEGVFARCLAATGRRVVGVDASAELLRLAQRGEEETPLGIEYRLDDARQLGTIADRSVDGVACNAAFMDLEDLGAVFASVHRVLRPGGWFAFATLHPCFERTDWRTVDVAGRVIRMVWGYFEEGDHPHRGELLGGLPFYHRTLSTLVQTLLDSGFSLERIVEPQPPAEVARECPSYAQVAEVLVVAATAREWAEP